MTDTTSNNHTNSEEIKRQQLLQRIEKFYEKKLPEHPNAASMPQVQVGGQNKFPIQIVDMYQSNVYQGVYNRLTDSQLAFLLKNRVDKAILRFKPHDGWPVHIVYPNNIPLEGPHTQLYPSVMTLLLLDNMDRFVMVIMFGHKMGDLDEIAEQLKTVSWEDISVEYAY